MKTIGKNKAAKLVAAGAEYAYCPTSDLDHDFRPYFFKTIKECEANKFVLGGNYKTATYVLQETMVRGEFKNHNGNYLPCFRKGYIKFRVKGFSI